MSSQDGGPEKLRVGIKFLRPASAMQASLDRYVFALMRRKARDSEERGEGAERRLAPRVELEEADGLLLMVLPATPEGVLGRVAQKGEQGPVFQVCDISTTGGCFISEGTTFTHGEQIRIRLQGEELNIELQAKVVYCRSF